MNNFENKIEKLEIPEIKNDALKRNLKKEMENKYFGEIANYKLRFRYAITGLATVMLVLVGFVLNPDLPRKMNNFVFNSENIERVKNDSNLSDSPNIDYTSITNPSLSDKINPLDFEEDTAYIIRKYNSDKEGAVLIVSEFEEGFSQKQKVSQTM